MVARVMFIANTYVQGPAPEEASAEREGTAVAGVDAVGEKNQADNGTGFGSSNNDGRQRRTNEEDSRSRRDSRPKLLPGVMVTITPLGAQAILEFNEEVLKRRLGPVAVDLRGVTRLCDVVRKFARFLFCFFAPRLLISGEAGSTHVGAIRG